MAQLTVGGVDQHRVALVQREVSDELRECCNEFGDDDGVKFALAGGGEAGCEGVCSFVVPDGVGGWHQSRLSRTVGEEGGRSMLRRAGCGARAASSGWRWWPGKPGDAEGIVVGGSFRQVWRDVGSTRLASSWHWSGRGGHGCDATVHGAPRLRRNGASAATV